MANHETESFGDMELRTSLASLDPKTREIINNYVESGWRQSQLEKEFGADIVEAAVLNNDRLLMLLDNNERSGDAA